MTPYDAVARQQLTQRMKSGANWFYWIAALSLVTSIISFTGSNWVFLVSLGITQFIDAVARELATRWGTGANIVALVFDFVAAGLFALLGYLASKRHEWAFVAGMALYALDAVIFIVFFSILPLAFHAFALYSIYGGYKAASALAELDKQTPPPAPEPMGQGSRQQEVAGNQ